MQVDIKKGTISNNLEETISFAEIVGVIQPLANDVVYLGGSIIEGGVDKYSMGMGNNYSDIDVFIIRDHNDFTSTEAVYNESSRKTYFVDGVLNGLDIEVYDFNFVSFLTAALKEYKPQADMRNKNSVKTLLPVGYNIDFLSTFLNRLMNSVCIFNNKSYESIKSKIDFNKYCTIKRDSLLVFLDNAYPDVEGNIEAGQNDVALYCMREIFLMLVGAVLANEGILFDRTKWLPVKLKNYTNLTGKYKQLWLNYLLLFKADLHSKDSCTSIIKDAMEFCKGVTEDILLGDLKL